MQEALRVATSLLRCIITDEVLQRISPGLQRSILMPVMQGMPIVASHLQRCICMQRESRRIFHLRWNFIQSPVPRAKLQVALNSQKVTKLVIMEYPRIFRKLGGSTTRHVP